MGEFARQQDYDRPFLWRRELSACHCIAAGTFIFSGVLVACVGSSGVLHVAGMFVCHNLLHMCMLLAKCRALKRQSKSSARLALFSRLLDMLDMYSNHAVSV